MKIETITKTEQNDGTKVFIVWIKDKGHGITKSGLTFKSFLTKRLIAYWLNSQKIYNIKQAFQMLIDAN